MGGRRVACQRGGAWGAKEKGEHLTPLHPPVQLLTPTLSKSARARLVITASPVHDPSSGGGDVGAPATLGDLAGMAAGPNFSMVDGGRMPAQTRIPTLCQASP